VQRVRALVLFFVSDYMHLCSWTIKKVADLLLSKLSLYTLYVVLRIPEKGSCIISNQFVGRMSQIKAIFLQRSEVFVDTTKIPIVKKRVKSIQEQDEFDSRRWVFVSLV